MILKVSMAYRWLNYPQIFFPRSIEGEIAAKEAARERRLTGSKSALSRQYTNESGQSRLTVNGRYLLHSSTVIRSDYSPEKAWNDEYSRDTRVPDVPSYPMPFRPNRRTESGDVELAQGINNEVLDGTLVTLSEENLHKHNDRMSGLNHLVYHYTSPIGKSAIRLALCYSLFIPLIDLASSPYGTREIPMKARDYRAP